ncbi:PKD domain-containing protein [Frigoribacterium sp. VKM Ac-2836]|uniref:PKD domain-containing protein n=1 Tax=Frigoribacterium sp. VKM Ac-2836 TaxID=2739014 RepID=UPI001565819B|nr:PKD domain-containing protein [Frigoribacterium sp. VKM Ac-2836]NRD26727.1 PKD domain-containing protein [Frigoribacterium sp. VKM Ac-2836]
MGRTVSSRLRLPAIVAASAVLLSVLVGVQPAAADSAPVDPTSPSTPATVTADALPAPQIDGSVFTQVIVGNTVYAAGKFSKARPAGAAAGVNEVPRSYLLAYDITTGVLSTTFAPVIDGQVKALAASPDGKRLYIGGAFTKVNGVNKYRLAALDPTTGALVTSWNPGTNATVNAIAAVGPNVYIAGVFSSIGKDTRSKAAAVTASNGTNLPWAPQVAGGDVLGLVASPDGSKIVLGGSFSSVNGSSQPGYGLAMLDSTSAANLPLQANDVVRNGGGQAAIYSLSATANGFYGSGYTFGGGGRLEGAFKSTWNGDLAWVEDCHGDTYSVAANSTAVYVAGHPHYCGNIGGQPQTNPWTFQRAMAFSDSATQTITNDPLGYYNFAGTPAPSILNWFPDFATGTYTGLSQGPWSVAANDTYVVYGGEFPSVNGKPQNGLVRFAVSSLAPNKTGPEASGALFTPSLVSLSSGTVRVSWQSNWDKDNANLSYAVYRDGDLTNPVYTTTSASTFWKRPALGFVDKDLAPGSTHSYRVRATDPLGNTALGDGVDVTVTADKVSPYAKQVAADGATSLWRLGEKSGSTVYDWVGYDDQKAQAGVTRGATGQAATDSDGSSTFSGTDTGLSSTASAIPGPQTFSVEAWFRTTSTTGGKIVGFGSSNTGASNSYDRHLYMDPRGRVSFGVYPNASRIITSPTALNDGQWHQVVGTLSSAGQSFYVDGKKVATDAGTTGAQDYTGYWRIGGDNNWDGAPYFQGDIDDVSVYPAALSAKQVDGQWVASGRTSKLPKAPADAYGARVFQDDPEAYFRLDGDASTVSADSSPVGTNGVVTGGVATGGTSAVGGSGQSATFNGQDAGVATTTSYDSPNDYTLETWFNTTTTSGGKLIGFGNQQTGYSGNYDRHVYMEQDGRLQFGNWTGQMNLASSTASYNDGRWHHVVATQGADGMKLYVDGTQVGSNASTRSDGYRGFWRLGGDSSWNSGSGYWAGSLDEAAVYARPLDATTIAQHYALGANKPNAAPTAAFTSTVSGLGAAFDGSTSADRDGSVASYAWDFGDGSATASGIKPTHAYAAGGTYTVTLTVTDDRGAVGTTTATVTVTPPRVNAAPTASFASTVDHLVVAVDGRASTDPDGSIASYRWDFGDGTAATTGATSGHTYAAAGTYTVTLTVTDGEGATGTSTGTVTVAPAPPANVAPTASFTSATTGLAVSTDASASTDPDGTLAGYAWTFGDGGTATGATASHTYAAAGTFTVTLTVTDDKGATGTSTGTVTVAPIPNAAPTASFTTATDKLTVTTDGRASTDTDGTVAAWAWDFGDGATATGSTAKHDFAAAGTYTVTLTVTDDKGATGTRTSTVTVTAPPVVTTVAQDGFGRTTTGGWGAAEVGGSWTRTGSASQYAVTGGVGTQFLGAAGWNSSMALTGVSTTDADLRTSVSLDKAATGGGTFVYVTGRKVATNSEYRATLRYRSDGRAVVALTAFKGSTTGVNLVGETLVPGTITPGAKLNVRLEVSGSGTTTIRAKVWADGTTEPTAWTVSTTDTYAGLQAPGWVALGAYASGSATNAPQTVSFDDLSVFKP